MKRPEVRKHAEALLAELHNYTNEEKRRVLTDAVRQLGKLKEIRERDLMNSYEEAQP